MSQITTDIWISHAFPEDYAILREVSIFYSLLIYS